jgi:hypothetical protein
MQSAMKLLGSVALAYMSAHPSVSHASSGQTAEGAQTFLAAMAKRGLAQATFIDAAGRANHVVGTHQVKTTRIKTSIKEESTSALVEKSLGALAVSALSAADAAGEMDACTTRIDAVQPPTVGLYEHKIDSWEEPGFLVSITVMQQQIWDYNAAFQSFAGPHFIDWRDTKVARSNDGTQITITAKGQKFPTNMLTFASPDTELLDRIEYAVKFLRLSCDEAGDTGF